MIISDHIAAAMTEVRDDMQARIDELTAELAEAMGECIDFVISYGLGDEDRYRARYRELTGRGWDEDADHE